MENNTNRTAAAAVFLGISSLTNRTAECSAAKFPMYQFALHFAMVFTHLEQKISQFQVRNSKANLFFE